MLKNNLIRPYLCHMSGDHYLDKITNDDVDILNEIVVSLLCRLADGSKIKVKLYTNPDEDFRHYTDFKIISL